MHNAAKKLKRADERLLLPGTTLSQDIERTVQLLRQHGWLYEQFTAVDAKGTTRWGLVFAESNRIQILQRRGWFTQFDSTHKTNVWGYNMFSFLVRDEHGIWIPAAHCVVERENSDVLAYAMQCFQRWCGWQPRYVLTDDSSIEQLAIQCAFPGLINGQQEVTHLLCTVHSMRTLNRHFKAEADKKILSLLRHAMFCFTGVKCRMLCEEAIAAARDEKTKNYIRAYWLETAQKWGMHARQHSPFLLQATTTNSCEAWHRKLKSGGGLRKGDARKHGMSESYEIEFQ